MGEENSEGTTVSYGNLNLNLNIVFLDCFACGSGLACALRSTTSRLTRFFKRQKPIRFSVSNKIFTYPMEMYVARHVFDVSVFQTMLGKGPITSARHYGLTVGIWALSLILAMSTNNLGSILEIFGAFSGSVSLCPLRDGLWCCLLICLFFLLLEVYVGVDSSQ